MLTPGATSATRNVGHIKRATHGGLRSVGEFGDLA